MRANRKQRVDSFANAVETALIHFQDSIWLGSKSPLAAPYFLGNLFSPDESVSQVDRQGDALQLALREAAENLDEEQKRLLNLVFFNQKANLDNVGLALALHMSERTFYRNKNKAIQALAQSLVQKLIPPLRPEVPLYQKMVGRSAIFDNSITSLTQGNSVYITGASGTGKTTLGAAIFNTWNQFNKSNNANSSENQHNAFWYTVRLGFNDYVANFIFALGYFLRGHGTFATWQQLVAEQGKIKIAHLIGTIRYDLKTIGHQRLLFCIDEVDLLEPESVEHIQIIHLLEELDKLAPFLFIGQRVTIEANEFHTLYGFDSTEMAAYLQHIGLTFQDDQTKQAILTYTKGNPALLTLLNALNKLGGDISEGLKALKNAPSIEALYIRILRRLSNEERHLLLQLIIFRNPAPLDAWAANLETLDLLKQYGLVQDDGLGAISVISHIRNIGYLRTPAELKPLLHLYAAEIREERNHIVSAMHHYIAANRPELAVWLWYTNRTTEIERGHSVSALRLLQNISSTELGDDRDRNVLLLSRGELFKLTGQPEEAETELSNAMIPRKGTFSAYVQQLQAELLEMQGQAEQAIKKYREALETLTNSQDMMEVTIRTRIGFLHEFSFQEREEARREAMLARIKAEGFHGNIEEISGNYVAARKRYQAAYDIAQQLDKDKNATLSRVCSQLGALTLREGQVTYAIELIEKAIECDQNRGDIVSPLYDMLNLAYAHTQTKNYDKALSVACNGLQIAERLGLSYLISGLACGAGEAYYGLGQLEKAEQYGRHSLAQEEGYFRCSALALLGIVQCQWNNFNEAEYLLNEAIASAKYAKDKYGEAYCWHMLANTFIEAGKFNIAHNAFESSLKLYQQLNLADKVNEIQNQRQELLIID